MSDDNITSSVLGDYIIGTDNITIDTSALTSSIIGPYPSYNVGIGAVGSNGSYGPTSITNNTWATFSNNKPSTLKVEGNAEFEGDVKIKGISIAKALEDIQKRLAILVPDPAKLEHFAALKKAYDHYKLLEALCELPTEPKE